MTQELITAEFVFEKVEAVREAGVHAPLTKEIQIPAASVPDREDLVRFDGLNDRDGKTAFFWVGERVYLFGGNDGPRVQLRVYHTERHY